MKKISIVISDLGSGGAQKIATTLAAYLAQTYDVQFITFDDGKTDFFKLPPSVKRVFLDENKTSANIIEALKNNALRIKKIRAAIQSQGPETVISFIAPTNILCILASYKLNTKLIICERNDPSRQSFGLLWNILRYGLYRFASIVTANSVVAIEAMKSYVPPQKLFLTPNHLQAPEIQYIKPFTHKENIILAVGRLHPQKSFDTLIRAFAKIYKNIPDWRLIILGQGPLENELKKLVNTLKLDDHIELVGVVNNPYDFYARAKIFALPSLHEGTSNAFLEAMSCGLVPIISSSTNSALNFIQSTTQIFNTGDANDLAKKLLTLIHDDQLSNLSLHAQNTAIPFCDQQKILKIWSDLI